MSMILDALTRAEHERQLEKQPNLKFVTPVKPQKKNPKKIWLWVAIGVLVNALVLLFAIRAITNNDAENNTPDMAQANQQRIEAKQNMPFASMERQISRPLQSDEINAQVQNQIETQATYTQDVASTDARPLAMEVQTTQIPEVDRPLIYESKQTKPQPKQTIANATTPETNVVKKGRVSFSSTELSADDAVPIIDKPRLLIDEGEVDEAVLPSGGISGVVALRDLPEGSRNNLNKYEVNVHVYDDDPLRRFVLINMDKYKEGDRIANSGPLVQQITPDGVVVDYGNGRALLPPK